jgi:MFS family permease
MTHLRTAASRTFKALSVRNYRLYFFAQVISVSGTWMQNIAIGWLVLHITGSGVDLGFVTALQFLPMLLFGSWGGLVADRFNKRTLLFMTQGSACAIALALGLLALHGTITVPELYAFASLLGIVNMFDNPARQTFVSEMVGRDLLPNAVSLNSVLMNSARVIGPSIAGLLLAAFSSDVVFGSAVCFIVNAATYLMVLLALLLMRRRDMFPNPRAERTKGQVREGLRYVWSTPALRNPLFAMAIVGIFAFNFQVTLALLARFTFHGNAGTYAALTTAMAAGAVAGGLIVAYRSRPSPRLLAGVGVAFGALICAVAASPRTVVALILLVPMGACSIAFIATSNATLQLAADPDKRGRVMALFAIAFLGSTPIGAPLVGAISSATNPRIALLVGGVATLAASGVLWWRSVSAPARRPVPATGPAPPVALAATGAGMPEIVAAPVGMSIAADETLWLEENDAVALTGEQPRTPGVAARPES